MINFEPISADYAAAKQELATFQRDVDTKEAKAAEMRREHSSAAAELERLLELEQSDHVTRILIGDDAAPKKPKRLTRIANLREQVSGIELALPIQEERIEEARSRLEEARAKVTSAVLPGIVEQKTKALQHCAEPLERLVDALVDLAAIDGLQELFSGRDGSITFSSEIEPGSLFSGRIILDRFRKSLPPRFLQLASETFADIDQRVANQVDAYATQIGV